MPYIHFTEEQKQQAQNTDLEQLLRRDGERLKRSGSEWEWRDLEGAKITIRGNEWFHQYEQTGGAAINFVIRFYNLSFPEAMQKLIGISAETIEEAAYKKPPVQKPFVLPLAHTDMRRVYAYLMQKRFIDRDVITHFAKAHTLYEDSGHHNAVFVGFDENGIARHAHKKSTNSVNDSFRGNVGGSLPEYSFHHIGTGSRLYVFEAPIDMLAYLSLHKDNWERESYAALCCVAEHAMLHQLKEHPHLQEVVICTDHDKAGIEAFYRLREILNGHGYFNVRHELAEYKDFDEDLKALNGEVPIPAREHPQLSYIHELCRQLSDFCKNKRCPPNAKLELWNGYNYLSRITNNGSNYREYADEIQKHCFDYAACACFCAKNMYRQIGQPVIEKQLCEKMAEMYRPHEDCNMLSGKLSDIKEDLKAAWDNTGVITESEFKKKIDNILQTGLDFLRINTYVALEQKAEQHSAIEGNLEMV